MTDIDIRLAETRGSSAKVIALRMRAGLDPWRVELAARLGHAGALEHYPNAIQVVWTDWYSRYDALRAAHEIDHTIPVRLAADLAEHVLPIYEAAYSGDSRPRAAIDAARAYAACPCERHKIAAYRAYVSAFDAATNATISESYSAAAAYIAATADITLADVGFAADACYYAFHAAKHGEAERTWQREHLITMILEIS